MPEPSSLAGPRRSRRAGRAPGVPIATSPIAVAVRMIPAGTSGSTVSSAVGSTVGSAVAVAVAVTVTVTVGVWSGVGVQEAAPVRTMAATASSATNELRATGAARRAATACFSLGASGRALRCQPLYTSAGRREAGRGPAPVHIFRPQGCGFPAPDAGPAVDRVVYIDLTETRAKNPLRALSGRD